MLFVFYLLKSVAYAWAEPASFAVNVLENSVTEVSEAAITASAIHASVYVFFPMCRFSFLPKSDFMPQNSSVAPPLTLMARIFAFEPFFQLAAFSCDREF